MQQLQLQVPQAWGWGWGGIISCPMFSFPKCLSPVLQHA